MDQRRVRLKRPFVLENSSVPLKNRLPEKVRDGPNGKDLLRIRDPDRLRLIVALDVKLICSVPEKLYDGVNDFEGDITTEELILETLKCFELESRLENEPLTVREN
jgi:hypothetical protein